MSASLVWWLGSSGMVHIVPFWFWWHDFGDIIHISFLVMPLLFPFIPESRWKRLEENGISGNGEQQIPQFHYRRKQVRKSERRYKNRNIIETIWFYRGGLFCFECVAYIVIIIILFIYYGRYKTDRQKSVCSRFSLPALLLGTWYLFGPESSYFDTCS